MTGAKGDDETSLIDFIELVQGMTFDFSSTGLGRTDLVWLNRIEI